MSEPAETDRDALAEDIRAAIAGAQKRADDVVHRCRSAVEYRAKHCVSLAEKRAEVRGLNSVTADDTGGSLGMTGESALAKASRCLDIAVAQSAAVRNVWLSVHAVLHPDGEGS